MNLKRLLVLISCFLFFPSFKIYAQSVAPTGTTVPPQYTCSPVYNGVCVRNEYVCTTGVDIPAGTCPLGERCRSSDENCTPSSNTCISVYGGVCVPNTYVCTAGVDISAGTCPSGERCRSSDETCVPPPSPYSSTSCCAGNNNCNNIKGSTYNVWLYCTKILNCNWTCAVPQAPTPIPTKPIPRVFCKPGSDVTNPGNTSQNPDDKGIATNLGCIPYETKPFVNSVLTWGVGIGSGITFLVIVYAAFLYVSSGGDPKKVQAAREMIVALLGGFGLIIFGIMLLNYLGVDLLGLKNLGFSQ